MTVGNENELQALRAVGRIVADVLRHMSERIEPGMTTRELDAIGRARMESQGARSAPEITYDFPGATCISINHEVAHGIPGEKAIRAGDLVNIDVSAEKDGFFADTGASFPVPPTSAEQAALCRAGRQTLSRAISSVKAGRRLNVVGKTISSEARKRGYSLIRNLQSHGVGRSLHEEPTFIPPYLDTRDLRSIHEGMVFTIEPFLSTGADWADDSGDGWTLVTDPDVMTVQYEHTIVATRRGPMVLTKGGF